MRRLFVLFLTVIGLAQTFFVAGASQAADWCQWQADHNPTNIHVQYQPNNQRLILIDKSRTVVQEIETGLVIPNFKEVNYSPNCRYLVGGIATTGNHFDTVIWDLESQPVRRVSIFEYSYERPYRVEWSPDSNYAVVAGREWVDLLRLPDGVQMRVTNKIISDCSINVVGCSGQLYGFDGLYWHPELNQLHMTLTDGDVAVIDLNNGQPIEFRNRQFELLPANQATMLREQMASPYGCTPKVQYQTYNQRLVLKNMTTGELVDVVQDHLALKQYRFLGWSPNCNYIAANIDNGAGLVTAIWDTRSNTQVAALAYDKATRYGFDWSAWAH